MKENPFFSEEMFNNPPPEDTLDNAEEDDDTGSESKTNPANEDNFDRQEPDTDTKDVENENLRNYPPNRTKDPEDLDDAPKNKELDETDTQPEGPDKGFKQDPYRLYPHPKADLDSNGQEPRVYPPK